MATVTVRNKNYDFPSILKGDTFRARQIQVTDENGDPPVNSLVAVKMKFRKDSKTGTETKYI